MYSSFMIHFHKPVKTNETILRHTEKYLSNKGYETIVHRKLVNIKPDLRHRKRHTPV